MRSRFDEQLAQLHDELIVMGALCENAIAMSAKALDEGDTEKAGEIIEHTAQVDRKAREIEDLCMRLLLQQQPVAKDLRAISSALKMVADMQRIGTNSGDIAEIIQMGHIRRQDDKLDIHEMALATIHMMTDSIDAFVESDVQLARAVIEYDDVVDAHFNRIKTALIERVRDHEADGEYTLDLLMIAKYLERMGDHAVNIAQWVLFSITGKK